MILIDVQRPRTRGRVTIRKDGDILWNDSTFHQNQLVLIFLRHQRLSSTLSDAGGVGGGGGGQITTTLIP